jgi:beta-glucosidase
MTNGDELLLVTGKDVPSANFSSIIPGDGSQGLEAYFYRSAFLESSAVAQTWDKELIKADFFAVGQEFYDKCYNLLNGPTVGPQGRTPWGGRLVETLGQDTYLAGIALGLATEGLREAGIIPCGKHFLLNEQKTNRTTVYWGNGA